MANIEQLEERYKKLQKEIQQEKKREKAKLIKQVGTKVIKETKVKSFDEFTNDWKLANTNPKTQEQSDIPVDTSLFSGVLDDAPAFAKSNALTSEQKDELVKIADEMTWTGNYWKIENISKVSKWLSQFRTKQDDK